MIVSYERRMIKTKTRDGGREEGSEGEREREGGRAGEREGEQERERAGEREGEQEREREGGRAGERGREIEGEREGDVVLPRYLHTLYIMGIQPYVYRKGFQML